MSGRLSEAARSRLEKIERDIPDLTEAERAYIRVILRTNPDACIILRCTCSSTPSVTPDGEVK